MKTGTKNIFKFHGARIDRALHNYAYFAFYSSYVRLFLKVGRYMVNQLPDSRLLHWAFAGVFERYHSKVITPAEIDQILTLEQDVVLGPDKTKKVIPYKHARDIIIEEPQWICVMDCPCRLSRENPCQPVNVCLAVGRHFAEFWEDVGDRYHVRRINQGQALALIKQQRAKGSITTAWFKVATGGRTGVICSCCSCCCGGWEAMRMAKTLTAGKTISNIAPSGYSIQIDESACVNCGNCFRYCKFDGMIRESTGRRIYDEKACMGCGLCVEHCQGGCLTLVRNEDKGLPLQLKTT